MFLPRKYGKMSENPTWHKNNILWGIFACTELWAIETGDKIGVSIPPKVFDTSQSGVFQMTRNNLLLPRKSVNFVII